MKRGGRWQRAQWLALFAVLGAFACGSPESVSDETHSEGEVDSLAKIEIAYPEEGEALPYDALPIWLRAPDPSAFDRMRVMLNGEDTTAAFLPWGARRQQTPEALAILSPRIGANHLEVLGADGRALAERRFERRPPGPALWLRTLVAGEDVPARVAIRGIDGTADPVLAPPIWEVIGPRGADAERRFVYTSNEPTQLHLPPGNYELLATRGPAYSMARAVIGPELRNVTLELVRVLPEDGWISADFHVHAIPSGDSSIPLADRVRGFRAQDVQVIIASDHHTITDYRAHWHGDEAWPEDFEAIPGVESNLDKLGHWNFWPLVPDASSSVPNKHGAPSYGGMRPDSLRTASELMQHFAELGANDRRVRFGDFGLVSQLNHPRGIQFLPGEEAQAAADYLNRVHYDPTRPLSDPRHAALLARASAAAPRPVDVDAIELLNRMAFGLYPRVRSDWFGWMRDGVVSTAVANSDTHWLMAPEAGLPRNWVRVGSERPVRAETLAAAVRARQVVGSTGPRIELEPWPTDGKPLRRPLSHLDVTVRAPAWIPVAELRLFVNGELAATHALPPAPRDPLAREAQEHRLRIPLDIDDDAFVVVEVGDSEERRQEREPHPGPLGRAFPELRVLAFSNALLVDARNDGTPWDE